MRHRLLALLIAAAACGGKAKPIEHPPLPDDKPPVAETKPAEETAEPQEPAELPLPQGPIEVTLPTPKVEVKLVNAGKGKKAKLALTSKVGAKQTTQLAINFGGTQDGPPELGGKVEDIAPTALLTAEIETKEVTSTGQTKFVLTFSAADATERTGQKVETEQFRSQMSTLVGASIRGTVEPNGHIKEATLRVERPSLATASSLRFLALSLLPLWPLLPTDAVAPGAKWMVTTSERLMDYIEVAKVVSYELVTKKNSVWIIKGTSSITGRDQTAQTTEGPVTFGSVAGTGAHDVALTDGNLLVTSTQSLSTSFTVSVASDAGQIKYRIERTNALTPLN